jgi:hypothetical protein
MCHGGKFTLTRRSPELKSRRDFPKRCSQIVSAYPSGAEYHDLCFDVAPEVHHLKDVKCQGSERVPWLYWATVNGIDASVVSQSSASVPLLPPSDLNSILKVSTGTVSIFTFIFVRPKSLEES